MHRQTFIRNADYRDAHGVDRSAALQALADLARRGILVREGERRGTRYRPGPTWESWVGEDHAIGS